VHIYFLSFRIYRSLLRIAYSCTTLRVASKAAHGRILAWRAGERKRERRRSPAMVECSSRIREKTRDERLSDNPASPLFKFQTGGSCAPTNRCSDGRSGCRPSVPSGSTASSGQRLLRGSSRITSNYVFSKIRIKNDAAMDPGSKIPEFRNIGTWKQLLFYFRALWQSLPCLLCQVEKNSKKERFGSEIVTQMRWLC